MRIQRRKFGFILALLLLPLATEAHPFNLATESESLVGGLAHPLTSSDHILTMLAIGLWVSQANRRWRYILPVVFVSFMLTGGMFPLLAIEIPFAKYIMYFSVLSLGLLLANAYKTSIITGGLIVAVVALFHGYVHVYDMMLDVSDSGYMTGFAVATLLLIIAGILSRYLVNYVFSGIGDGALMKDESE